MTITDINKPIQIVHADFEGKKARCGKCKSVLGEFNAVEGEIKCRKNDCKALNILKR